MNGVPEEQVAFAPHGYDLFVDSPLYRFASEARVGMILRNITVRRSGWASQLWLANGADFPATTVITGTRNFA